MATLRQNSRRGQSPQIGPRQTQKLVGHDLLRFLNQQHVRTYKMTAISLHFRTWKSLSVPTMTLCVCVRLTTGADPIPTGTCCEDAGLPTCFGRKD